MSLIIVNDKTLNFPDHEHLIKSLLFQLKRYIFYAVYFFRYCLSVFFSNYINLTSAILISLTSIAFIQNKEPKIKIPKYFRLNNITIFVLLSSAWFFYPLFYNYIHIPISNTIFTYSLFLLPLIFNFL